MISQAGVSKPVVDEASYRSWCWMYYIFAGFDTAGAASNFTSVHLPRYETFLQLASVNLTPSSYEQLPFICEDLKTYF